MGAATRGEYDPAVVAAVLTMAAILFIGTGLTLWCATPLRAEERVAVGGVVGVAAVAVASFVWFRLVGMSSSTLWFALAVTGAPAVSGAWTNRARWWHEARDAGRRMRLPARDPRSLRPFVAFNLACVVVATRILALGYQTTPDGVSAGHLATWADWAAHQSYAASFAYGDNRALELPIAAGEPLRYHFFANYLGGLFTTTGLELRRSLIVTTWLLAVLVPPLMWCAVTRLVRSRAVAAVSILLFTLTGGVGAWYLLDDIRTGGWSVVTQLPRTYSRITEQHLWLDNTIAASLYSQRSTLLGVTIGLAALVLLLASRPSSKRSGFVVAGVLVGLSGIGWVHLMFSALALGALAGLADRRARAGAATWWWFLVPAAVTGLPLAWAITPERNSLRWHVGWMAPAAEQSWIVFWLRNAALLLPLFLGISLLGGVPHRLRRLSAPLWLWFIVPNLVAFHPWDWNNTKFFIFWQWAGSIVVAAWLVERVRWATRRRADDAADDGSGRYRRFAVVAAVAAGCALLLASLTVTGAVDTVRAMQRTSATPWATAADVEAAEWLRRNHAPGDVLVYGATNTSAVAASSGVPAVSGYPGWTDDLGLVDWLDRWAASMEILGGGPRTDELIARYGVDFVVLGPQEIAEATADPTFWDRRGTKVFELDGYRIYRTSR
jgi:hypothetical protein